MLPRDPLGFMVTFLPSETRRLTRTGVEIHCLQYWDDGLEPWVGRHHHVRVYYDPRDVTVVYVRSPAGVIVKAKVTTSGVPAISLAEWKARREYEHGLAGSPENVAIADASRKRCKRLVSEATADRKALRRQATAAAGDRYRAESAPTASAVPNPAIEPDLVDSEAVLPEFAEVHIYDIEDDLYDYV